MDISASALSAQRLRMTIVAENIANAQTTRTADGTPYRRRVAIFQEREPERFSNYLRSASSIAGQAGRGVRVAEVAEDPSEFRLQYEPSHPDADELGYVRMPNVDTVTEMVDMMAASRAYEANITALDAIKAMAARALEIGR